MAEPVKVRRLTDEEGRKMQQLVGRGEGKGKALVVRYRRALVILASAGGSRPGATFRKGVLVESSLKEEEVAA